MKHIGVSLWVNGSQCTHLKYCTIPGPREQLNQITSYIDASLVYGSDHELAETLRDSNTSTVLHFAGLFYIYPPG